MVRLSPSNDREGLGGQARKGKGFEAVSKRILRQLGNAHVPSNSFRALNAVHNSRLFGGFEPHRHPLCWPAGGQRRDFLLSC